MAESLKEPLKFFKTPYWILALIVYIINITLIVYFNPLDVMNNYTRAVTFFSIFAGFLNLLLFSYFYIKPNDKPDNVLGFLYNVGKILSVLFIFYGLLYAVFYYVVFTPWPLAGIVTILNILAVIGILAFVFKYFKQELETHHPKTATTAGKVFELIKYLIFYIPCLLIDLVDFIKHQYNITTKTVWIILLIELIIIALRFLIPFLYKKYHKTEGSLVEKGPIYLNNEKDLGAFQNDKPTDLDITKEHNFNYNYAISSWIWINPQPESTSPAYNESTQLLNYGDVLKINYNKNKLEFWASTTENAAKTSFGQNKQVKIFELVNIPYQKWNNIVLNYDGGTLDIFFNNSLVSSTINITPVMHYNKVTSGAINGINGGIKDVVYYNKVLSKNDIYSIYSGG